MSRTMGKRIGTALAAAGLAAVSLVSTGGGADAATWTPNGHSTYGHFTFVMVGRIAHVPGNAHSGNVDLPQNDGDNGTLNDWNCPKGVTPPVDRDAATDCTLLRSILAYEGSTTAFPDVGWGMRTVHSASEHTDVEDLLTGEYIDVTVYSDYTIFGSGPITTATYYSQLPDFNTRQIDRTRAFNRATGHFGWINFSDPRVKIVNGTVTGSFFSIQYT